MLGAQTRLNLTPDQTALLTDWLETGSRIARTAYQKVCTGKLDAKKVYSWASQQGLTSHQAKSISYQVDTWQATDQGTLNYRINALKLRVDALERAVTVLDSKLTKAKSAFATERDKKSLPYWQQSRFYKHRSLCNKKEEITRLEAELKQGQFHRVFGGKKLLAQRTRLNEASSPWADLASWRQEWERKRGGTWTLPGAGDQTSGNQSAQIVFAQMSEKEESQKKSSATSEVPTLLRVRLTQPQADQRLKDRAKELGCQTKELKAKMALKCLEIPVQFCEKSEARLRKAQALNLPLTVSIQEKIIPGSRKAVARRGKRDAHGRQKAQARGNRGKTKRPVAPIPAMPALKTAFYCHVSFDLPRPAAITSRHQGALGVDLNAWGLAYACVGPDGNLLRDTVPLQSDSTQTPPAKRGPALKGNLILSLLGKTTEQRKAIIREACHSLVAIAVKHRLAISVEDLSFIKKKSALRENSRRYARMLSALQSSGFADILESACRKAGIPFHRVNPAWTSVAGYAKYGKRLGLSIDQAAGYQIGRAAVLGKLPESHNKPLPTLITQGKKKGQKLSLKFLRGLQKKRDRAVIRYQEPVCLSQPLPVDHQRTINGHIGCSWQHVRKVLGPRSGWHQQWSSKAEGSGASPVSAKVAKATAASLVLTQTRDRKGVSAGVLARPRLQDVATFSFSSVSTDVVNG